MAFYEYELSEDGLGYYISFDYNEDLVRAIKQVPHIARRWDPEDRVWFVDRNWFVDAKRWLDAAIERNTGRKENLGRERKTSHDEGQAWNEWKKDPFTGRTTQAPQTDPVLQAFSTLHLQSTAPEPVIDAVYRVLSKVHHPDVGGSHEAQRDLNLAYEKAKKFVQEK